MTDASGSCGFSTRLTPRADRDEIRGVDDTGTLVVRVSAPPVDGAANEALIRLLSRELGIPRSGVVITSGLTVRVKRVRVDAASDLVRARWPGLIVVG